MRTIMVSTPDRKTVQHSWWVNGYWMVRWVTNLSQNAPTELGLGGILPWGWSPGPWSSSCRWACWYTCHPKWGVRRATLPLWRNSLAQKTLPPLLQGHQWPSTGYVLPAGFPWSLQTQAEGIKTSSGNGSCIITSWGRIAGSSIFSVAAYQSPLWAAIRDPLEQTMYCGYGYGCNCGGDPLGWVLPAWVQLPLPN